MYHLSLNPAVDANLEEENFPDLALNLQEAVDTSWNAGKVFWKSSALLITE